MTTPAGRVPVLKFLGFVSFVLGPIFGGVRWLLWLMLFLMLGDSINAMLISIPTADQVIKVRGTIR